MRKYHVSLSDYVLKDHYLPQLEKRWAELAPYVLDYDYTVRPEDKESVAAKIKEHYFKDKPISLASFGNLVQVSAIHLNETSVRVMRLL